jgi:hypothetical protein
MPDNPPTIAAGGTWCACNRTDTKTHVLDPVQGCPELPIQPTGAQFADDYVDPWRETKPFPARETYPPTRRLDELRDDLHLMLDAFRDGRPVVATDAHRRAYERLRVFAGLERPETIPTYERPRWWLGLPNPFRRETNT